MNDSTFPREFRVSRAKLVHGAVIAGLLTLLGLWLIVFAGPTVAQAELLGLANLALAAGILFVALRRVRDPRPHLVLDRDGIWFRDWDLERVPWRQVREITTSGIRLQGFVCIELRDPQALLDTLSREQRGKLDSNRLVRLPRLMIPNGALDTPFPELLAALRSGLETFQS